MPAPPSRPPRRKPFRFAPALLAAWLGGCCTAPPRAALPEPAQAGRSAAELPEAGTVPPRRVH